jgi:hypothetical protein
LQEYSGLSPQSGTHLFLANFQEALTFWSFCVKTKGQRIVTVPEYHLSAPECHVAAPENHLSTSECHVATPDYQVFKPECQVYAPYYHVVMPESHVFVPE